MAIKNLSFKIKLLLPLALLMAAALFALSLLVSSLLKNEIAESLSTDIRSNLELTHDIASQWVQGKINIMNSLAKTLPATPENWETWEGPLTQGLHSGDFDLMYVGTAQGEMIQSQPPVSLPEGFDPRTRPWYQQAIAKGDLTITAPYVDAASGDLIISFAQPLASEKDSVLGSDLRISAIVDQLLSSSMRWSSQIWLLDEEGRILAHPDSEYLQKNITDITASPESGVLEFEGQRWLTDATRVAETGWVFRILVNAEEVDAGAKKLLLNLTLFVFGVIFASCGLLYWLITRLVRPLKQLDTSLAAITQGKVDLDFRLPVTTQDELGRINRTFNHFLAQLEKLLNQSAQASHQLQDQAASGSAMADDGQTQLQLLQERLEHLETAESSLVSASEQIASNAENTATYAQQTVASTEQGKDCVEKNQASIQSLARQLEASKASLGQVDTQVQEINGILETIQSVAEQTNLLALNAAIEAARAGEQGRGFAVVADEVRVLAQRTSKATEQIHEVTHELEKATGAAIAQMDASYHQAEETVASSDQAVNYLTEINQANIEISRMAQQTAQAVDVQLEALSATRNASQEIEEVTETLHRHTQDQARNAAELEGLTRQLANKPRFS